VRGDGLGLVPTNRPASFVITAPDARLGDIGVAITSKFEATFKHNVYLCVPFILHCSIFYVNKQLVILVIFS